MAGFTRNGPLEKVGLSAQDTAELVFEDVRVPRANLLGEENKASSTCGTICRRSGSASRSRRWRLPGARSRPRASTLSTAPRSAERLADLQTTRFYLAELATEIEIAQTLRPTAASPTPPDKVLDEVTAAMAKWWVTELHLRVVHRAVQFQRGGYGFMKEYSVARDYLDSRAGPSTAARPRS